MATLCISFLSNLLTHDFICVPIDASMLTQCLDINPNSKENRQISRNIEHQCKIIEEIVGYLFYVGLAFYTVNYLVLTFICIFVAFSCLGSARYDDWIVWRLLILEIGTSKLNGVISKWKFNKSRSWWFNVIDRFM